MRDMDELLRALQLLGGGQAAKYVFLSFCLSLASSSLELVPCLLERWLLQRATADVRLPLCSLLRLLDRFMAVAKIVEQDLEKERLAEEAAMDTSVNGSLAPEESSRHASR